MELHGYLDHGYRVLSHPDGKATPEILEQAEHVELPDLNRETVIELKLDGHEGGRTLPDCCWWPSATPCTRPCRSCSSGSTTRRNWSCPRACCTPTRSIRKLVAGIDEEDWQEVEIIGWLYQFYISEQKRRSDRQGRRQRGHPGRHAAVHAELDRQVPRPEHARSAMAGDLPAVAALRQQMEYYIEPAEQTPEVQEQLKAITPTSLNPEEITFLDPACGSGHILVEAYDLFKAIYQERGYRAKDIPRLILQKNLFGLEIDDRAAQLAAFALMMKARADDRRIFDQRSEAEHPGVFRRARVMDAAEHHACPERAHPQGETAA